MACASSRTRVGAALGTAVVIVSAAAPTVVWTGARPLHSPFLSLLVPAASAVVLTAVRERLLNDREALRDFALSDPLTGIANRRLLLARADYEIARHQRAQRSFALVMLDLDGFKLLNDRFGHAAGDDLLREVALALMRSMPPRTRSRESAGTNSVCLLRRLTKWEPTGSRYGSRARCAT